MIDYFTVEVAELSFPVTQFDFTSSIPSNSRHLPFCSEWYCAAATTVGSIGTVPIELPAGYHIQQRYARDFLLRLVEGNDPQTNAGPGGTICPPEPCYVTGLINVSAFGTSVVPIPAAAWLFGSALLGLGWMRRKS